MYHTTTICLLLVIKCAASLYQVHELPQRTRFARLSDNQVRHLQRQGFGPTTSSFRPTTPEYHRAYYEQNDGDSHTAPSEHLQTRAVGDDNYPARNTIPGSPPRPLHKLHAQYQQRPDHELERRLQTKEGGKGQVPKEEEEIEEPDRLSLLLPDSKFDCVGKNTGYYADDGLGCEVFHYCHDNARHSWICPDGFTFHQVHLICMPPGKDNICEQSTKYHFVNEYLYRPVNLEEHQHKPNVTLKYAERYYPETHYQDEREEQQQQTRQSNQPIRVSLEQQPGPQVSHQQARRPQQPSAGYRPQTTVGQVFRSPEEVNISLQQRRPAYVTQRYQLDQDFF